MYLIYEEAPFQIFHEEKVTEDMIRLLEETYWGTGKTVYQHFNNREHLLHIPRPTIFTARENGVLRAQVVFCRRYFPDFPGDEHLYYLRFFCASPKVKGKGIIRELSGIVMDWVRREEGRVCFYAIIEAHNKAVRKVTEKIKLFPIATLKTVGFSRFFPRMKENIEQLNTEEWETFLPRLQNYYAGHGFWTTDNLNVKHNYWVIREGGRIVAGMQVHRAHWAVQKLAGALGRFLVPVLPNLPLLRRIFNPRSFHFLTLEGIFAEPGYESRLPAVMESLLRQFGQYTALIWLDERDPMYAFLTSEDLGLMNVFVKDADAKFLLSLQGFDEEESRRFTEKPIYISGYDNI